MEVSQLRISRQNAWLFLEIFHRRRIQLFFATSTHALPTFLECQLITNFLRAVICLSNTTSNARIHSHSVPLCHAKHFITVTSDSETLFWSALFFPLFIFEISYRRVFLASHFWHFLCHRCFPCDSHILHRDKPKFNRGERLSSTNFFSCAKHA